MAYGALSGMLLDTTVLRMKAKQSKAKQTDTSLPSTLLSDLIDLNRVKA